MRDRDAELAKANEEVDKRVRETSHEYETLIADLEFRHKRAVREAVQRAAMQDDTELDGLHEEVRVLRALWLQRVAWCVCVCVVRDSCACVCCSVALFFSASARTWAWRSTDSATWRSASDA